MMEMSKRARRMDRRHKRFKQPGLNLVSLMDVFTILVFFLLISSTSSQQIPNSKDLRLPTSISKKAPKETTIITVTSNNILVQGRGVATIGQVLQSKDIIIPGLQNELGFLSSKTVQASNPEGRKQGLPVTIMGDENLSYELLRRILATCRQANYTQIAFAAMQKAKKS